MSDKVNPSLMCWTKCEHCDSVDVPTIHFSCCFGSALDKLKKQPVNIQVMYYKVMYSKYFKRGIAWKRKDLTK